MCYDNKYKIILKQGDTLDSNYKQMIEILMGISDLDESDIVDRKDSWVEDVVELNTYEITLRLSNDEYNELKKNFVVVKVEPDKLQKEDIDNINKLLANIIQSKEDICSIVQGKCKICPLNIDDKCNELNLPEFDFENYQWLDDYE